MQPYRQQKDDKQEESDASHLVAIQPSAGRLRHKRVKRDVGRKEPEVNDGVQGNRK
jgi:hypothetical protein